MNLTFLSHIKQNKVDGFNFSRADQEKKNQDSTIIFSDMLASRQDEDFYSVSAYDPPLLLNSFNQNILSNNQEFESSLYNYEPTPSVINQQASSSEFQDIESTKDVSIFSEKELASVESQNENSLDNFRREESGQTKGIDPHQSKEVKAEDKKDDDSTAENKKVETQEKSGKDLKLEEKVIVKDYSKVRKNIKSKKIKLKNNLKTVSEKFNASAKTKEGNTRKAFEKNKSTDFKLASSETREVAFVKGLEHSSLAKNDKSALVNKDNLRESKENRFQVLKMKQVKSLKSKSSSDIGNSSAKNENGESKGKVFTDFMKPADLKAETPTSEIQPKFTKFLKENGIDQIVKQAKIVLKDNDSGQVKLILKPENLGTIKINFNINDNRIVGKIIVENNSIREAFQESLNDLNNALAESGFDSSALDVSLSQSRSREGSGFQFDSKSMVAHNDEDSVSLNYGKNAFYQEGNGEVLNLIL